MDKKKLSFLSLVFQVLKPVLACMILTTVVVRFFDLRQFGTNSQIQFQKFTTIGYEENDLDQQSFRVSIQQAMLFIAFVLVATFVLLALYYFKCNLILKVYLWLAVFDSLLLFHALIIAPALMKFRILDVKLIDEKWFILGIYGFVMSVYGTYVVLYQKSTSQKILLVMIALPYIEIGVLISDQTVFIALILIVVYDIYAVMLPCGPLRLFINLAIQRNDPLPTLIYETTNHYDKFRQLQTSGKPNYQQTLQNTQQFDQSLEHSLLSDDEANVQIIFPSKELLELQQSSTMNTNDGNYAQSQKSSSISDSTDNMIDHSDNHLASEKENFKEFLNPPLNVIQTSFNSHYQKQASNNEQGQNSSYENQVNDEQHQLIDSSNQIYIFNNSFYDNENKIKNDRVDNYQVYSQQQQDSRDISFNQIDWRHFKQKQNQNQNQNLGLKNLSDSNCSSQKQLHCDSSIKSLDLHQKSPCNDDYNFVYNQKLQTVPQDEQLQNKYQQAAEQDYYDDSLDQSYSKQLQENEILDSVQIGIGDLVFYGILVGKAALCDYVTTILTCLAIIIGIIFTLHFLIRYQKCLPALPISLVLGLLTYAISQLTIMPRFQ